MHRRQFIQGLGIAVGTTLAMPATTANESVPVGTTGGRTMDSQELDDLLLGSSYLGCGGGGGLAEARELIRADLEAGFEFRKLSVSELGDDDWVASPYTLGTLAPMSKELQEQLQRIGPIELPVLRAFRLLEEYVGKRFAAVIVGEIGPLSTAEALSLGARLGVPSLDADTVGRATPEINQHSVRVAGHDITPAAGVTLFGDEVILDSIKDPSREETIFRNLSEISRDVGVCDAAISGTVARAPYVLVQDSLTLSTAIGEAVRQSAAAGEDPIDAARSAGDGYLLFTGRVRDFDWADSEGFLVGTVDLDGDGAYSGQRLHLDYKNEHLVAKRDDDIIATCPDLITMVDNTTFEGVGNPEFEKGQSVSVLGYRSDAVWRRPEGLAVFEPRYFGYDIPFVPIEQRLAR
ncbi:MAG: DUF917 domain-containing protein [Woeseiaceae bacterium]|nr:DUF917 domain-containing protein [Woeseiaceae bacterium]